MGKFFIRLNTLALVVLIAFALIATGLELKSALSLDCRHYQFKNGIFNPDAYLQAQSGLSDVPQSQKIFDESFEAAKDARENMISVAIFFYFLSPVYLVLCSSIFSWLFGAGFHFHLDAEFKAAISKKLKFFSIDRKILGQKDV